MRKILFRGRTKDGEWLFGDLLRNRAGMFAVVPPFKPDMSNECSYYEVLPRTIGQYTGLKDRNGKKIFEGDIVRWDDDSRGKYWTFAVVCFDPDIKLDCRPISSICGVKNSFRGIFSFGNFIYRDTELYIEVIGNIHDNTELLKEEAK